MLCPHRWLPLLFHISPPIRSGIVIQITSSVPLLSPLTPDDKTCNSLRLWRYIMHRDPGSRLFRFEKCIRMGSHFIGFSACKASAPKNKTAAFQSHQSEGSEIGRFKAVFPLLSLSLSKGECSPRKLESFLEEKPAVAGYPTWEQIQTNTEWRGKKTMMK